MGGRGSATSSVWILLVSYQQPEINTFIRDLVARSTYSRRSVLRALRELEDQGYITRTYAGERFPCSVEPPVTIHLNRVNRPEIVEQTAVPAGGWDVPEAVV